MINVYDFDKTIYDGDSSVDFYLYCLKRKKSIILLLPIQIFALILYILKLKDKEYFKGKFFSFVKKINVDEYVKDFWKENINKIKPWYIENKKETDIIISASPDFLLKRIKKKLKIDRIIASEVNKKTGEFLSKNCYGKEKVERYNSEVKNKKIENFYSDSLSDLPMMEVSKNAFIVKGSKVTEYREKIRKDYKKHMLIDKILLFTGILYLVIPIIIQLYFWFNRIISIPLIILLLVATYLVMKRLKPLEANEYRKIFEKKKLLIFIIFLLGINVLSGAGAIFQQNWDYHGRNAIFRDLIENEWPVRYDYSHLEYESQKFGDSAFLNYYFAYWLPGALIGKVSNFKVASLFMLVWQIIGSGLFFYYIFRFMKKIKIRYLLAFLAFGGLNVIGHIIVNYMTGQPINPIGTTHIDTSMGVFCMSTFITQLFWVFNQSIPAWVAVMLFLQEKDYKTCGYYFALLVPFGPFPMIGFLYLIFTYIIFGKKLDKLINWERIKELLTIPNFFGCASVLPIVFMYTLNESKKGVWFINAYQNGTLLSTITNYILFVILEYLVYIIIVNRKNYKQLIMCFLFFTIAPLFFIGGADLGNRSTIPLLIILYILVIQTIDTIDKTNKKQFMIQKILTLILLVASITNFNEIYRSLKYTYYNGINSNLNYADSYQTFKTFEGKECSIFITNFVATDDKKNKVLQFILRD